MRTDSFLPVRHAPYFPVAQKDTVRSSPAHPRVLPQNSWLAGNADRHYTGFCFKDNPSSRGHTTEGRTEEEGQERRAGPVDFSCKATPPSPGYLFLKEDLLIG